MFIHLRKEVEEYKTHDNLIKWRLMHPMLNEQKEKLPNGIIWLSVDFETVKQRIDSITDQIKEVLLKSESQGASDLFSQGKKPEDIL